MTLAIIQVFVIQVILPVAFILSLWKTKYPTRLDWIIQLLFTVVFITWLFLSGRWDWVGIYLKFVWVLLLIPAIYLSWKNTKSLPFRTKLNRSQKFSRGFNIVLLLIFGLYTTSSVSGYSTEDEPIELAFPLKDGSYYIAHGGSATQINYHNAYEPQQYALDIVKLNQFRTRANGIYPKELDKYEIFGDIVYSACSGSVVETRNNSPDLIPPESNPDQPEGNYVAIACDGTDAILYIVHLLEGSITVEAGEQLTVGNPIGQIGNSGNTSEPHLHIHAEKDGIGVPLQFDEEFLVRNDVVKKERVNK
ncbi:M23 family metallopeptidase [Oceanobacillus profundus]|uniref:M23 family peptidase n=1 Tax=Oceanobacillus profundus TaxID=372463 RepID=A0A417YNF9_9BACI|nr:M23 family metallopeptidase [Oceanobacillus profundus]MCM3398746.1 M23 family metallopeptidase [Oceanobacillus profundus]PAE30647.1 peptidase M23 [Paenibacillus sp. 7884-2]RHW35352.1 M23 family peptidase [Oceanobacillus profundus]